MVISACVEKCASVRADRRSANASATFLDPGPEALCGMASMASLRKRLRVVSTEPSEEVMLLSAMREI